MKSLSRSTPRVNFKPGDSFLFPPYLFRMKDNSKEQKPLNKMTIDDVFATDEALEVGKFELDKVWQDRKNFKYQQDLRSRRMQNHPVDDLHKDGYFEPSKMIKLYQNIVAKKHVEITAKMRETVITLGNIIFHETMRVLIKKEDEAKGDIADRGDK